MLKPDKSLATSAVIASGTTCKASPVLNRDASRAYCATTDGNVVCFSVSYVSGTVSLAPLWTRQLPMEETVGNEAIGTSLVATPSLAESGSRLYVVTGSGSPTRGHGRLFALSTVDGQDSSGWSGGKPAGGATFSHFAPSPAIMADGKIVVASALSPASIKAFNPDGSVAWNTVLGQMVQGSPAIGTDGRIFVTTWTDPGINWTICLNGSSGTELWRVEIVTLTKGGPVISSFGEVVVSDVGGNVYGFTQDGKNAQNQTGYRWTVNAASWGSTHQGGVVPCQAALIDAGGNAIVVEHNGWIRSIAPNGTARWTSSISIPSGESLYGSPTMTSGGKVLVLANSGNLYSFDNAFGPDEGIWPSFQRGPSHSGNIGENPVDRPELMYTATPYSGLTEYVWDPESGGAMQIVNSSSVNAANDFGHVVGVSSYQQSYGYKAVEWLGGQILDFAASYDSSARGINDAGEAVGWRIPSSGGYSEAVFWQRAPWGLSVGYPLNRPSDWPSAEARALNNARTIVGRGVNPNGIPRAMLWPYQGSGSGGSLHGEGIDLGSFEQGNQFTWSEAVGISVLDEVGGNTALETGTGTWVRPFRFRYSTSNPHITPGDKLPEPDFAALGIANGVQPANLRNQVALTLSRNGQLAGNVQPYASGEAYVPFVHRPATTAAASYRIFPEWTFSPSPYPRTYRPTQMLAYNGRGQSLLRADVFDPTLGMQYLGQAYVVHTPTRTGYVDVSSLVSSGGGIEGLTDDGKIFGWRYQNTGSTYIPTGFVAVPSNTP